VPEPGAGQLLIRVPARGGASAGRDLPDLSILPWRSGESLRARALRRPPLDGGYAEYLLADARYCLPVPAARGSSVVRAGIQMSDIPAFPYRDLCAERLIRSVANLTRQHGLDFMAFAARTPLRTEVHEFALADATAALVRLRVGAFTGAALLRP